MKFDRIFPWATVYFGVLGVISGLFAIAGGVATGRMPGDLIEVLFMTSLVTGIGAGVAFLGGLASLVFAGGYHLWTGLGEESAPAASPDEDA